MKPINERENPILKQLLELWRFRDGNGFAALDEVDDNLNDEEIIDAILENYAEMQVEGGIPEDILDQVGSFSELHEHFDANDLVAPLFLIDVSLANRAIEKMDRKIKERKE